MEVSFCRGIGIDGDTRLYIGSQVDAFLQDKAAAGAERPEEILLKCNNIPGNIDAEMMVCYTEH